jgi:ABC-type polysaccharide/polyol phosphate transport system ATPase subunit
VSTAVSQRSPGAAAQPTTAPAVSVRNVSKSFHIPRERYNTLKERALHAFRPTPYDVLEAVDDVSVDIAEGEFFGIVGRNGSGKSTLLKCLAGIYGLDSGTVDIRGRLSPFIELGVGFNPELAARDNVIINGIMLGLTRKEAYARLAAVLAFAELEEFADLKLKNYSSGMHVRLAFSIAIQVDADILLIDEVLAVGDANFQQKCYDEFNRMKAEGRTIVLVTHDMAAVEHFCDRALVMDHGRVVKIGDPETVAREYNSLNFRAVRAEALISNGPEALKRPPVAEIVSGMFEDLDGSALTGVHQGGPSPVRIEVRFHADAVNPIFGIALRDDRGRIAFATSSELQGGATGTFREGDTATVKLQFDNWLAPGRYTLEASVTPDGLGGNAYDLRQGLATILVLATRSGGGAADLPHELKIERA